MWDLVFGVLVIVALAVAAFAGGLALARRVHKALAGLAAVVVILAAAMYEVHLRDSVWLLRLLPFSNTIVLGNWAAIAAGFLAGLAWRLTPGSFLRRAWPVVGLALAGGYVLVHPLLGSPPPCRDLWAAGNICRQSSPATCSPACAATLLARCGIQTTEQEMARLCLTRNGTRWQGLYRGLKKKIADTGFRVEVFDCPVDRLSELAPGPLILSVGLPRDARADSVYSRRWGWSPGELHTVLLLAFRHDGRVQMADPAVGLEQWTPEGLRTLYRGRGMRLAAADRNFSPPAKCH